ncbi:hypothetical protein [Tropicibacter sp. S64]|uniref:hypothetical protein n=1 Tax=Tropicibacter sp. S64 TaxID=3415122 RepID=UPI003C7DF561
MTSRDERGTKAPLWRKVNTRTHGVHHRGGGGTKARHLRGTKAADDTAHPAHGMAQGVRHGVDYTPLYRFLLSKVGEPWETVHAEAVSRLDREGAIFHVVDLDGSDGPLARTGESSYMARLCVDGNGRLAWVDPDLRIEHLFPACSCCTHTFNGKPFVNRYDPEKRGLIHR